MIFTRGLFLYLQLFQIWRDQNGRVEVDCIIDLGISLIPVEIKFGETINPDFFDSIKHWSKLSETDPSNGYLVYAGDSSRYSASGHLRKNPEN